MNYVIRKTEDNPLRLFIPEKINNVMKQEIPRPWEFFYKAPDPAPEDRDRTPLPVGPGVSGMIRYDDSAIMRKAGYPVESEGDTAASIFFKVSLDNKKMLNDLKEATEIISKFQDKKSPEDFHPDLKDWIELAPAWANWFGVDKDGMCVYYNKKPRTDYSYKVFYCQENGSYEPSIKTIPHQENWSPETHLFKLPERGLKTGNKIKSKNGNIFKVEHYGKNCLGEDLFLLKKINNPADFIVERENFILEHYTIICD